MTSITVSLSGLESVIAQYQGLPKQIQAATTRTIRKTVGWVATQSRREVAGSVGVAQSVIKSRLASKAVGAQGVVWFGLNQLSISQKRFPTLRQTKTGAKAGSLTFDGAFVAKMPTGAIGAFRRTGRARLPIRMESIPIDTPAVRQIIAAQARKAAAHAAEVLAQELNYEINVKGAR